MQGFITEFKAFAMKGNVIDLAVAVIIGTAFGKIATSLVNNIIMPLLGVVLGGVDFTDRAFVVGSAEVTYGIFIQSVIEFIIIALVVFTILRIFQSLQKQEKEKPEEEKVVEPSEEIKLLREIRDSLKQ